MRTKLISIVLLASSLMAIYSHAQTSNLVFYCNEGERFTVIMNGIRQNPAPETNVKITQLNQPYYKVKLLFENQAMPPIEKNVNFNQGTETVFAVKKNNKGEWILRWQSETPLAQVLPPPPEQKIIVFTTTPPPATTTVISTTTTVTGTGTQPQGEGVSIGVNANDAGMGVNFNVFTGSGGQTQGTSTTTTTTTTTTSGGVVHHAEEPVCFLPGYNGPVGCPGPPMLQNDFAGVKQSISSKSFEDSKKQIAKQVISSNCLLSSQVKEILLLFSFEDSRLEIAKYAYGYTYDVGNYYKINDAFTFESSIDELNEYIQSVKR